MSEKIIKIITEVLNKNEIFLDDHTYYGEIAQEIYEKIRKQYTILEIEK